MINKKNITTYQQRLITGCKQGVNKNRNGKKLTQYIQTNNDFMITCTLCKVN